jgi:hypothetical protein
MKQVIPFLTPQSEIKKAFEKNLELIQREEEKKKQDEALNELESYCSDLKFELENNNKIKTGTNLKKKEKILKNINETMDWVYNIYNTKSYENVTLNLIKKKLNDLKIEKEKLIK